jgi:hypothetical protein
MRAQALTRSTAVAALIVLLAGCSSQSATPSSTSPAASSVAAGQPTVVTAAGDITSAIDRYRTTLGADNGGDPVTHTTGRREINWDAVPDANATPNNLPSEFFNATTAPRARGAILKTDGGGVQVSANEGTGVLPRFGNINPTYPSEFKTYSPQRLFSPVGSNAVDLTFTVPGTQTPAAVRGFGAVYTDIDTEHTAFEYFDAAGKSLGKFAVPIADKGLSFLGVAFDQPVVARVRIVYGQVALGPNDSATNDVAVMDDFIYGEPQAIKP